MIDSARRLRRSLQKHGVVGSGVLMLRLGYSTLRLLSPSRRRAVLEHRQQDLQYDLEHGVDTAGIKSLNALEINSEGWEHGYQYEAVHPAEFRDMMSAAGDVATGRVFVDYGCGKGRAMFLAAEYPFTRVVGFDFAPQLVEAARRNLLSYRGRCSCAHLEVSVCDAAAFDLPEEPLVLFFYNPFGPEVMSKVVNRVCDSLDRLPRPLTVLYNTPKHDDLWAKVPALRKAQTCPGYSIYHAVW